MEQFSGIGKLLIISGAVLMIFGLIIVFAGKIPFFGKLPGDLSFRGRNWTVYIPIATSIVLSILLSLGLYIIRRFF
ncbi:DUF2905 domain-containing protein [Cytophagaceae bacterium ABcell3]|nr:DUF2905 domain-containing protein [Cytophagaceae bacterium ABcell3]